MSNHANLPRLALSIRQPWTWAIINLDKRVENRSWNTKVRGPICLHASQGMKQSEFDGFIEFVDQRFPEQSYKSGDLTVYDLHHGATRRGGIVATAEIVDCVMDHDSPWFFGPYGFVLANVQPVEFIKCRGALGFFDWRAKLQGGAA